MRSIPSKRLVKYGLFTLVMLCLLYPSGRLAHKYIDSLYFGQRAPYLQLPTPEAITIRWQSEENYIGKVAYGESPHTLDHHVTESSSGTGHEIRLHNLKPNTRYYYSAGAQQQAEYTGEAYWFKTSPLPGESTPARFWVIGDSGEKGLLQEQVRDEMLRWIKEHPLQGRTVPDLLLTTGDNAYRSGSNPQYQEAFFDPFQKILRNTPVWPGYGNHDQRRPVFYKIFTLPEQGEAGGIPSGSEHYFSFDYANTHVVFLDTESSKLDRTGEMATWLTKDLAANTQTWTLCVLHHPPYSKGSHDSDDPTNSEGKMVQVREQIVPILEEHDVDLVLSGHSHSYERSHLLSGHYGDSSTLSSEMILDSDNSYEKESQRSGHRGTVYAVVGSSSKLNTAPLDHPVMAASKYEGISMLLEISGNRLTARSINSGGIQVDAFSIVKPDAPR